jgi:starch-binding outer membrane protein, SusD/RagB family
MLMAAESLNETGAGAQAATLVNQVRSRVGLAGVTFVDQAQMRTAIKKERRSELGLEGERFFDLVRWGDALNVLSPLGYQNRCRFYPIPQPEIDKSGGKLIQNPEWN